MGAFQPRFIGHAGHGAVLASQVKFEIRFLKLVARFAQGLVQREGLADLRAGVHGRYRWLGAQGGAQASTCCGSLNLRAHRRRMVVHLVFGQPLLHRFEELLHGDGFFQESQSTNAGGLNRCVDGGVATHHDDRHGQQATCGPLFEQGHAIGIGHPDVEQDQVGALTLTRQPRLRSVLCHFHLVSLVVENFSQQIADTQLVVDHQNVCHDACCVSSTGGCLRSCHAE